MNKSRIAFAAIFLGCMAIIATTAVYAHGSPPPKPTPVAKTQKQSQSQGQKQTVKVVSNTKSNANANANSKSTANSGSSSIASSVAGDSTSNAVSGDSAANNNLQIEGDTYTQVRQAPATSQGSFAIQGCGAAGNAGGSNTHGSAFLGFGFTPAECYAFLLAQSYQATGQEQAACEVLNSTRSARKAAKRGVKLPECGPVAAVSTPADTYTKAETDERLDRAFRRSQSK